MTALPVIRVVSDRPNHPTLAAFARLVAGAPGADFGGAGRTDARGSDAAGRDDVVGRSGDTVHDASRSAAGPAVPRARDPHAGKRVCRTVEFVHPRDPLTDHGAAVLYLLKSREAEALQLARQAEAAGVRVVNSVAATETCLDRAAMAQVARGAGLPFPVTRAFAGRRGVVEWAGGRAGESRRFVLKSRHSRRSNPVPVVGTADEIAAAAATWADESLVVQDFADGDGWDHKFWVIGDHVFAGLRLPPEGVTGASVPVELPAVPGRSGLTSVVDAAERAELRSAAKRTVELPPHAVPVGWSALVRRVGDAFGLSVFGVDLLAAPAGPVVVDVNAFPGFQGVTGAAEALAALAAECVADADPPGGAGRQTATPLRRPAP